jgi:hypothetical protein
MQSRTKKRPSGRAERPSLDIWLEACGVLAEAHLQSGARQQCGPKKGHYQICEKDGGTGPSRACVAQPTATSLRLRARSHARAITFSRYTGSLA